MIGMCTDNDGVYRENAGKFLREAPELHTLSGDEAAGGEYGVISFVSNFSAYPPVTTAGCTPTVPSSGK